MGSTMSCSRAGPSVRCARGGPGGGCEVPDGVAGTCGTVGGIFFEPEGCTHRIVVFCGDTAIPPLMVGDGQGEFEKHEGGNFCGGCLCRGVGVIIFLLLAGYGLMAFYQVDASELVGDLPPEVGEPLSKAIKAVSSVKMPALIPTFDAAATQPNGDKSSSFRGSSATTSSPTSTSQTMTPALTGFPSLSALLTAPPAALPTAPPLPLLITPAPPSMPVVTVATARSSEIRYHCVEGREDARDAAAVYAEWTTVDKNLDGHASRAELVDQKDSLSGKTLATLIDGDVDGDGSLSREEFTAALIQSKEEAFKSAEDIDTADWSDDKKTWCCEHAGIACPDTTTTTTTFGYDCEDELDNWDKAWPAKKKKWCCDHHQKGCRPNCDEGDVGDWGRFKQGWCCEHEQKGCAPSPTTTTSQEKRQGTIEGEGCDTMCTFRDMKSTCKERVLWSAQHAFKNERQACARSIEKVLDECQICSVCPLAETGCKDDASDIDGRPAGDGGVLFEKPVVDGPSLYHCSVGAPSLWTEAQKAWCCAHKQLGCEAIDGATSGSISPPLAKPTGEGAIFLCEANPDWENSWSFEKKDWCCTNMNVGCHNIVPDTASSDDEFNCNNGLDTWAWGWSDAKKDWCCRQEQKGCADSSAITK
mmetsp:Transcript_2644/g.7628  ORF Transcript_2644/g.7628 Transcript_2644/m.7628 type:complete len:643 (-) Transcript_2644:70-1998(-)